jgi:hypothetical protein
MLFPFEVPFEQAEVDRTARVSRFPRPHRRGPIEGSLGRPFAGHRDSVDFRDPIVAAPLSNALACGSSRSLDDHRTITATG